MMSAFRVVSDAMAIPVILITSSISEDILTLLD